MKYTILLLAAGTALFAQSSQITMTLTGPATAKPGTTITLQLAATGTGADTGAAGLQWTLALPLSGGYAATATAGAASTAANKSLYCSADALFCLLVGMNVTPIPNGSVATYAVKVPINATAGTATQFTLSGLIGASAAGTAVPTMAGAPYALMVLAKQDINGDGKVDTADVQAMLNEVIASQGNPTACTDDMNGDGRCDLLDVLNVLLKVLGQ